MELPCDASGACMVCKIVPPDCDVLLCNGCSSPWHMRCLRPPMESVPEADWTCPDCSLVDAPPAAVAHGEDDLLSKIRAIQADPSISEAEKAKRRQKLLSGSASAGLQPAAVTEQWICLYCIKTLDRPVTAPCGHNYCLKCLETACKKGQKCCPKCRAAFGKAFSEQPRINSALVQAIRMSKEPLVAAPASKSEYVQNEKKPEKAYVTDKAKKNGLANAASGKLFVDVPKDYFGAILKEHDMKYGRGISVGQSWSDRLACRQWGIHRPHVAGIAGQADVGAQSVVLSGGYIDDEDHGEWFLYTGSGGRDLSGNKRTNKEQSFDQEFTQYNEALRRSCEMGYPVRVVRSHKEHRSSYAPSEKCVRYDGLYRIEKCWRKKGIQGYAVCRYLFVRCDNEPAPWTSEAHGDRPRPVPQPKELKSAFDITERRGTPHWGWKEEDGTWCWLKPPPVTTTRQTKLGPRKRLSLQMKLKKEFACGICKNVLERPVSSPCGHNFCEACLLSSFAGQKDNRQRGGCRSLRVQKAVKPCPSCKKDISDFLIQPKVNNDMDAIIQSLKKEIETLERDTQAGCAAESVEEAENPSDDEIEVDGDCTVVAVDAPIEDKKSEDNSVQAAKQSVAKLSETRDHKPSGQSPVIQDISRSLDVFKDEDTSQDAEKQDAKQDVKQEMEDEPKPSGMKPKWNKRNSKAVKRAKGQCSATAQVDNSNSDVSEERQAKEKAVSKKSGRKRKTTERVEMPKSKVSRSSSKAAMKAIEEQSSDTTDKEKDVADESGEETSQAIGEAAGEQSSSPAQGVVMGRRYRTRAQRSNLQPPSKTRKNEVIVIDD